MKKRQYYKAVFVVLSFIICIVYISRTFALDDNPTMDCWGQTISLNPTQVTAPNGTVVPAWIAETDLEITAQNASKAYYEERYSEEMAEGLVIFKRYATVAYNCHSYAWYSQDANNMIWIDSVSPYINDYSYAECSIDELYGTSETIIVAYCYGNYINHSGILQKVTISNPTLEQLMVTSKWGYDGLYEHRLYICPYYNEDVTIKFYVRHYTHSYTASYDFYDDTYHKANCACGASQNMPHIFLVANPNFASQCRFCGQLSNALSAGELATLMANGSIEYTENGGYRLPSGVIYLMPEDLDAYLDGTLTFKSDNKAMTE